jgi:scyllo-inositol 2-dehydrogenase (NADP+)
MGASFVVEWLDRRMSQARRVALVGYGLAGRVFHGPLITSTPGLRVAAVVTGNADRAARARDDLGDVDILPTADALWPDADEYDLVVIATANVAHAALAEAALTNGLDVVVDKPLARNERTARHLVDLARHHHRRLHVFQNRRWDSDFRTIRALLEDGALGHVHRLESRFERWRPQLSGAWRESADHDQMGGLLYDLGSHLVDQAIQLLGPVRAVYAETRAVRDPAAADDDVFVALSHESGALSHLWASAVAATPGPRFRVLGSRAAFVIDGLDSQEERLRAGQRPSADEPWGEEPVERWGRLWPSGEAVEAVPGAWPEFYARVAACLEGRCEPPVEPEGVLDAVAVLDAARESSRRGRVIDL